MRAFFAAGHNTIKRDEIAARQRHILLELMPRVKAAADRREGDVYADEGSGVSV
jgi:hypothetical protein